MRTVGIIIFFSIFTMAARVEEHMWPPKYGVVEYMHENNISIPMQKISRKLKKSFESVTAGEKIYESREDGVLLQSLISIGNDKQISIYREHNGTYSLSIEPVVYHTIRDTVAVQVKKNLRKEIDTKTNNPKLTFLLSRLVDDKSVFRRLQPENKVVFSYTQKERLGKPWGQPHIESALILVKNRSVFAYVDQQGKRHSGIYKKIPYTVMEKRPFSYTTVKKVSAPHFRMPVAHPRITSPFSLRRWHPILHKYRPHHGVDFGGRVGTTLYATDDGVVIYAGWMSGYGKTTKIRHAGGFVSLYGHQSKILVRKGMRVKRGQVIGKMGSTGRSTGSHLHYGLYLHNKPVDPMKYIGKRGSGKSKTVREKHTVVKEFPVKKYRKVLVPYANSLKRALEKYIKDNYRQNYLWNGYNKNMILIDDIIIDAKSKKEAEGG